MGHKLSVISDYKSWAIWPNLKSKLLPLLCQKDTHMNPTTKRLLAKKNLSGKDIGRLLIANMIDIHQDKGLPHEKIWELMQSVQTEQDNIDYELYRKVFFAIDEARDLFMEKMKQAETACIGLQLFNDAVFFANAFYPDCRWIKYCLGKMTRQTRDTGFNLWLALRNNVQAIWAIRGAITAAGAWLKIPKLETILPEDKKLRSKVDELDNFAYHARTELEKKNLPKKLFDEVYEIFTPIIFDLGKPTKTDIAKAQEKLRLQTFEVDIEYAIDMLNPYCEDDE